VAYYVATSEGRVKGGVGIREEGKFYSKEVLGGMSVSAGRDTGPWGLSCRGRGFWISAVTVGADREASWETEGDPDDSAGK